MLTYNQIDIGCAASHRPKCAINKTQHGRAFPRDIQMNNKQEIITGHNGLL